MAASEVKHLRWVVILIYWCHKVTWNLSPYFYRFVFLHTAVGVFVCVFLTCCACHGNCGAFFSTGLSTDSQLFSYCLLPSSVSVISCCHICPCDEIFILILTLYQLSAGLFVATELAHMCFPGKVAFQVDTLKDWIANWFAQVCVSSSLFHSNLSDLEVDTKN